MLARATAFPSPIHDGSTALWHLRNMLDWFRDEQGQTIEDSLMELAFETRSLKVARQVASVGKASLPKAWMSLEA